MAVNLRFPSAEEQQFCAEVNALLRDYGAKVSAYEVQRSDDSCSYCLTFEMGSQRRNMQSDVPFHYDPPQEVVAKVLDWIERARQSNRWSTELPADLED